MAKRKNTITDMPEPPKHHERQQLVKVDDIRKRVIARLKAVVGDVRSHLSYIDGNEKAVERLRGRSGQIILGRCATFMMAELGDNSTAKAECDPGVSRAVETLMRMSTPRREQDAAEAAEATSEETPDGSGETTAAA